MDRCTRHACLFRYLYLHNAFRNVANAVFAHIKAVLLNLKTAFVMIIILYVTYKFAMLKLKPLRLTFIE